MSFQVNLKKFREIKGWSQDEFAERLGVSQSTVGMWESGVNKPRVKTLEKITKILGITSNDLMNDSYSSPLRIPVYGYIPAGIPLEAIEDILDYEEVPESWSDGGKEFFGLKIKGDSMEPEYRNGDVIIFLKQNDCESNEDCAVAVNGNDWTFKRVEKLTNGILVKPLNPSYETKFYTNQECEELPVEVKGVFWELRRSRSKRK